VPGFYNRDHQVFIDYAECSKTEQGYLDWRRRWVDEAAALAGYIQRVGAKRLAGLAIGHPAPAEPADYGY
jgi:hypothetical protein